MKHVVVLGAGITGLTSAWKLSENYKIDVIEKENEIGGISSSFKYKDCILDYGPHKIYTQLPHIQKEIENLIGKEELLEIPKKSRIYLKKKFFSYPVSFTELIFKLNPFLTFKIGISFMFVKLKSIFHKKDRTYEDYLFNRFGKGLYNLVFRGYAEKVWGNPKNLSYELAKMRVSIPNLSTLIKSMIFKKSRPDISADKFYYPKNGIITLSKNMQKKIKLKEGDVHLNSEVKKIKVENNIVKEIIFESKKNKKSIKPDYVISTIPIKHLPKLMDAPEEVKKAAENIRYRSLIILYLVINKKRLFLDNWIFFPEKEIMFNRISEQKGFSTHTIPGDKTILTVEISSEKEGYPINLEDKEIFEKVLIDLEKIGIITRENIQDYFLVRMDNIYPIYDLKFKENINIILNYLGNIKNLITNGRQGLFNYNNMDHCMDMGIKASEYIKNKETNWKDRIKEFENYRIVD